MSSSPDVGTPSRAGHAAAASPISPIGSDELDDQQLAARFRVAVGRMHRQLRRESLAGLSPSQASALGSVHRLGAPTLGELALAELVQPPTMTRLVGGLEDAGLITRRADASDKRVIRVQLTREGRRVLQRVKTLRTAFLARRLATLGPEERSAACRAVEVLERMAGEP